jgi:UDP-GlcNAc:undecaprenyl-phosphate GlcNAc-1-phosphate transferase
MTDVVLSLVVSFVISFFSIPAIITIAKLKKLVDVPDHRKVHLNPVVSLGGVGIFAGFALSFLLSLSFREAPEFQYILAAALIIFFLGIKDDILIISPMKKFAGQILAALIVIFKGGIQISDMHGFLGIHELPDPAAIVLTIFTILVIVNSFNLIDGVDGLAASLGLFASAVLGVYFLVTDSLPYAIFSFAMTGSLLAFLYYNFQPAKIFMGDTGSLLIGLVCSVLVIHFIDVAPGNAVFPVLSAPAIAFSILFIPLLDTLRVFGYRILKGRSPFSGDRNHIHHIMLRMGLSHKKITYCLVAANVVVAGSVYAIKGIGTTWLITLMTLVYFMAIKTFSVISERKQMADTVKELEQEGTIQLKAVRKIVISKKAVAE